ncbi:putative asparagine synthase [Athelia psychrophila]|uniref:Asparagine synthase n=1 Tax=Athelia psychrophila TaxID=1759441 RepID=A0A166FDY0_9AGAM|nr:putative asparagine synthase [Fibularhizoctonia sp. CBS 109695]
MCGISAVYYPDPVASPNDADSLKVALEDSLQAIQHRGPDSYGTYISPDRRVGLGHVRLSIIDLAHGQQPLSDEDEVIHCVVNGELYDYANIRSDLEAKGSIFKTQSDSELVVQLYKHHGVDLFPLLRGEFAFVLYDKRRHLLFSARDRFGIKPLYYTLSGGRLLLASEAKAFPALGWKPEWDLESIVNNGNLTDDRTIFKGVFKLPPGQYLTFDRFARLKTVTYWDLTYEKPAAPIQSLDEMVMSVRDHLTEAVKLRLRSDVPLAVYLSGGIDSAVVAGLATSILRKTNPDAKLTTFTLAFPDAGDKVDEGPIARRMAASIGADFITVEPSEADLVNTIDQCVYHSEGPISSFHGPGKIILSKFVVLSGEGSDEIFGGYASLLLDYLRQPDHLAEDLNIPTPSAIERDAILHKLENTPPSQDHLSISDSSFSDAKVARSMLGGICSHRLYASMTPPGEIFLPTLLQKTGQPDGTRAVAEGFDGRVRHNAQSGHWHSLHTALYTVSKTQMPNFVLNQEGERAEMANSLEGRPPFLDHKLVEYVNTLPPSVKIMPICEKNEETGEKSWSFVEKWILRQAVKPYVTDELFNRKKAQYNAPLARPGKIVQNAARLSPLQEVFRARLNRATVERLGWANWRVIEPILSSYLATPESPTDGGLDRRARLLLYLLSFVILQERFNVPSAQLRPREAKHAVRVSWTASSVSSAGVKVAEDLNSQLRRILV